MAYTEFYVTKGASAANTNGGGPSLGANDGPVDTANNCSSNAAGTTITDDDSGTWPNSSVGDWVCFDTAGSKDFARITNIAGSVLTVTPAVTGSASSKTTNVGGAWATVDHAASTVTTSFVNAASDPPRVNIKSGTYSEAVTNDNSGAKGNPIRFEGYGTSAGDYGTPPLIDGNTGDVWKTGGCDFITLVNLRLETSTANKKALWNQYSGGNSSQNTFIDLTLQAGSGASGIGYYDNGYSTDVHLLRVHVKSSGGDGFRTTQGAYTVFESCTSDDAGGHAFSVDNGWAEHIFFVNCVANSPTTDGFYFVDADCLAVMSHCTVWDAGSDGVAIAATTGNEGDGKIYGCVFDTCGAYGINLASGVYVYEDYNSFRACTTSNRNNVDAVGYHDSDQPGGTAVTGDPFTDTSTDDFRPDDTAGEGKALWAEGCGPADQTNNRDRGAVQHADPAGGGGSGTIRRHPKVLGGA